jgi:hypothetical protein
VTREELDPHYCAVEKMIAVCPELPVPEVARGLGRLRERLEFVPRLEVLAHALGNHSGLR